MVLHFSRDKKSLVKDNGHIKLRDACVRANQTGFFALGERVNPESYDGNDTNINPSDCFFGGRRVELATRIKDASEVASRPAPKPNASDEGSGSGSGEGNS